MSFVLPGHQQPDNGPGADLARVVHLPRRGSRARPARPGQNPGTASLTGTKGGDGGSPGQGRWQEPEQIKDLYEAELRARGLDIPPEDILDAHVCLITGDYLAAARVFGRSLVGLAKLFNLVNRPPR